MMEVDNPGGGDRALPDVQLPHRQRDQPIFRNLRRENVESNCYTIRFDNAVTLHQYEFRFFVDSPNDKKQKDGEEKKDLSQRKKIDVANENRRNLLWNLWLQLIEKNPKMFTDPLQFVYDCGVMVVSPVLLKLNNVPEKIVLDADLLDPVSRAFLPRVITELYVEIKHIDEVFIENQRLSADAGGEKGRLALQLLEIIYTQKILSQNRFHVFPHKQFLKEANDGNINGRVIKDGLAKGVRFCGDSNRIGLMLQAEIVKSAFFPKQKLADYLLRAFNCRDIDDLRRKFNDRRDRSKLDKEVKKLTLITTHLEKKKIFVCDGFDTKEARDRTFSLEEKKDANGTPIKKQLVSVADYIEGKYRMRLNFYKFPCVFTNVMRDGQKVQLYYPLDLVEIVDGQRIPLNKMEPRFQDEMIKKTRMNPEDMKKATGHVMRTAELDDRNQYAHRFGVPLDPRAIKLDAELLPAPAIKFGGNAKDEPTRDGVLGWRPPQNRQYLIPGKCDRWMVVNYNNAVDPRVLQDFVVKFVNRLKERGARINPPVETIMESRDDKIFEKALQNKAEYVLVVTKDKMDSVHDALKFGEIRHKIVTQHLWAQTVFNVVRKNQQITLENVVMKTNEKLKGTNFVVVTSQALASAGSSLNRILETNWLGNNRLFVGIDLSHAGPGKAPGKLPSVVGMAYNVDGDLSLTGHYFYQEANQTIIKRLAEQLEKPILEYKSRSKDRKWPSHVIIYRSGVSEGEYSQVIRYEKSNIEKCFKDLKVKHPDFVEPGFTFLVAQRNNGFRLCPGNPNRNARNDADRNLKPGTCLTKGITDPILEQFILVAHRTIQGTCRPIMYTVLADQGPHGANKRISLDELRYITFALCHLHNNVLGTVNTPSVLYHAGQVAKRGRNNLKMDTFGTTNDDSTVSDSKKKKQEELNQDDGYTDDLSRRLQVAFNHKYWA